MAENDFGELARRLGAKAAGEGLDRESALELAERILRWAENLLD